MLDDSLTFACIEVHTFAYDANIIFFSPSPSPLQIKYQNVNEMCRKQKYIRKINILNNIFNSFSLTPFISAIERIIVVFRDIFFVRSENDEDKFMAEQNARDFRPQYLNVYLYLIIFVSGDSFIYTLSHVVSARWKITNIQPREKVERDNQLSRSAWGPVQRLERFGGVLDNPLLISLEETVM